MKSKFSEIVSKYLFSYGSVAVPGIGTFSISDSSSGFKLENDVITPPTKMIEFSETISEEGGLVKYLKNNHGYSKKDAEKKISEYSKKFLNDLLNYGVANIPGIGQLSKYANGEIVFDPAKEYLITSNYMLPALQLTPLGSSPVTTEQPAPEASKPIAAAAAAIPTAATTAAFLGAENKPAPTPPVTPPAPVEVEKPAPVAEVKKPVTVVEPKKPAPVAPLTKETKPLVKKEPVVSKPIAKIPEPIHYPEERGFFSEWKWIILALLGLIALSIFGVKCFSKYIGGGDNAITESIENVKSTITGESSEKSPDLEEYLKDKPKLQKYAKYLTMEIVETGCIIIVGTYNKSRNVIRMKDKIRRAGLDPYTELHNGLTRVGVIFPCKDHDLVEYIGTLRKSFDNGAWYLSPRMDVPR